MRSCPRAFRLSSWSIIITSSLGLDLGVLKTHRAYAFRLVFHHVIARSAKLLATGTGASSHDRLLDDSSRGDK